MDSHMVTRLNVISWIGCPFPETSIKYLYYLGGIICDSQTVPLCITLTGVYFTMYC